MSWPIVHDASMMYYLIYLMDHGYIPYEQIVDITMPFTHMFHWIVYHLFGIEPIAWRCIDLLLSVLAATAFFIIGRPYGWFSGFLSAALFFLYHTIADGLQMGERDYIASCLLLSGTMFLFLSIRRKVPYWLLLTAIAGVYATAIKPVLALIIPIQLILAMFHLRQNKIPLSRYLSIFFLGTLIALTSIVVFLISFHALKGFLNNLSLILYYAKLGNPPYCMLFFKLITYGEACNLLFISAFFICLMDKKQGYHWESAAIFISGILGFFSYMIQGKGYYYHTYPFIAFMLLWSCIVLVQRLSVQKKLLLSSSLFLIFTGLVSYSSIQRLKIKYDENTVFSIQADLAKLGGKKLSGTVQCLELYAGCINSLLRSDILQATGFLSDFYFFRSIEGPVEKKLRSQFANLIIKNPPNVFILSDETWMDDTSEPPHSFYFISRWPFFNEFLNKNYRMVYERKKWKDKPLSWHYRIYVRTTEHLLLHSMTSS